MQHNHSKEDFERGYAFCKHCNDYVHLLQAGSDCETWTRCGKCNCWVVSRDDFKGVDTTHE